MNNHLLPKLAIISSVKKSSGDSLLYTLHYKNNAKFDFIPGQFIMAGVVGYGEAPFDICSDPTQNKKFQISVRACGSLTNKMHTLKKGDILTVRGPYGNGLPHIEKLPKKNIVFVGGGCGFVTSRAFILKFIKDKLYKDRKMQLFYGVKSDDLILFKNDFKNWHKNEIDLFVALEKGTDTPICKDDTCKFAKGMVTDLFTKYKPLIDATYIMCGPPIMYKFVIAKLLELGVMPEDIYISLERRMHCGLGVCQHCAIGPYYVCKDGPVFRYDKIKDIPDVLYNWLENDLKN